MPLAIVVEVIAFPSTDVELEVDCSIRTASVVVEVLLDVEVVDVVEEDVVDELDVDVSATSVVLVVDVVVDVVVVSGVADAASEARLRPFTFSAFTVMA